MKKTTKETRIIMENLKRLTSEQLKDLIFFLEWLSTASEAEKMKHTEIMTSQDPDAIEAFIESLKNKTTSSMTEVEVI